MAIEGGFREETTAERSSSADERLNCPGIGHDRRATPGVRPAKDRNSLESAVIKFFAVNGLNLSSPRLDQHKGHGKLV